MNKKLSNVERFELLTDSIAIDIMTMSDDEVIELAANTFGGEENITTTFDKVMSQATHNIGKKRFEEAKKKLAEERLAQESSKISSLPMDKKQKVLDMIQRNSKMFSMAARNSIGSQSDVDSLLEDLVQLGIIDNDGNLL